MRLIRKRVEIHGGQHRPTLNHADVDVLEYEEAIAQGFTSVYSLLLKHRDELLAEGGPLLRFAEDEVRVIVRPTRTYAILLDESFHPDVLRDALDRDQHFDRLWNEIEHRPNLAKAIQSERDDLLRGDIAMFTTRPYARDMWDSVNKRIVDFFDKPGLELVQWRIQQCSAEDLARQLWYIRASLTTLAMDNAPWPRYALAEPTTSVDRQRLHAAACAIGERLESLALRGENDVSWIGLKVEQDRYWSLVPLGFELYDGLAGVTLFLAYLGALTGEQRYTTLAQSSLTTLRRQIERGQSHLTSIGGFSGWGGIIYLLTHLGVLWNQPELFVEAEDIVARLPDAIAHDECLDVIGGAAGCIASLLSLYHCRLSRQTLEVAIRCGDRLVDRAQAMQDGSGWSTSISQQPLAGFSHGAAGIAWALLRLAAVTGDTRFRGVAIDAIRFERSLFVPEVGNWPDLRIFEELQPTQIEGQQKFMNACCAGGGCSGRPV